MNTRRLSKALATAGLIAAVAVIPLGRAVPAHDARVAPALSAGSWERTIEAQDSIEAQDPQGPRDLRRGGTALRTGDARDVVGGGGFTLSMTPPPISPFLP